jgi:AcrR family transcriptional regulator
MTTVDLGLRERKRIATRRAIQLAAVTLVRDNGLDKLTVDEIGRVADISPRTFFNYFPTKEAAIVGDAPGITDDESVERFIAAGPKQSVLAGIATLVNEASAHGAEDAELSQLRREVVKQHPHLFAMRMATMKQFEDRLCGVVEQRLRNDDPALDGERLASRARLITLVSMAAMRHAWTCWADAGGSADLAAQLHDSFGELETLLATKPAA